MNIPKIYYPVPNFITASPVLPGFNWHQLAYLGFTWHFWHHLALPGITWFILVSILVVYIYIFICKLEEGISFLFLI